MLADAHQQAALEIERSIADLGDPAVNPWHARALIELYWGAAFHWIAYGCQVKHGKHKENHTKLVSYLRGLGELGVSDLWDNLDRRRNGGWYGHQTMLPVVLEVAGYWRDIRTWALT